MTYAMTRDLAVYRLNTQRWMRVHRTLLSLRATPRPEWMQRNLARVMSAPTESEMRAMWGDR